MGLFTEQMIVVLKGKMFKEERAMIVRKAEKKKKKQKSLISQKSSEGNVSNKSDYD